MKKTIVVTGAAGYIGGQTALMLADLGHRVVGIDKAIRIGRERWKIGYYFTAGYSNIFEKPRFGFKINIQGYDRYNNVWR